MMRVCYENLLEKHSTFDAGSIPPRPPPVWNTAFNAAPRLGLVLAGLRPFVVGTVETGQLKVRSGGAQLAPGAGLEPIHALSNLPNTPSPPTPAPHQITLANRPDWWDTELQLRAADQALGHPAASAASPPVSPARSTRRSGGGRRRAPPAALVIPDAPPPTPLPQQARGAAPWQRPGAAAAAPPAPPCVPVARLVAQPVQLSYVMAAVTGDIHVNATTPDIEFLDVRLASAALYRDSPAATAAAPTPTAGSSAAGHPAPPSAAGDGGAAGAEAAASAASDAALLLRAAVGARGSSSNLAELVHEGSYASAASSFAAAAGAGSTHRRAGGMVRSSSAQFAAADGAAGAAPAPSSLSRQQTAARALSPIASSWRSAVRGPREAATEAAATAEQGRMEGGGLAGDNSEDDSEQDLGAGFETYPYVLQPGLMEGEEAPGISLIRLLEELPASEAAHLSAAPAGAAPPAPSPGAPRPRAGRAASQAARPAFHFAYSLTSDGTTACQLSAASALVQWPFLCDTSLASALTSIFLPNWGRPQPPLGQALMLRRWPWLYFNVVLRDSQVRGEGLFPACVLRSEYADSPGSAVCAHSCSPIHLLSSTGVCARPVSPPGADAAGRLRHAAHALGPVPGPAAEAGCRIG
jgi:hypothetical protein